MFKLGFRKIKVVESNAGVDKAGEIVSARSQSSMISVDESDAHEILAFSGELKTLVEKVNRDVSSIVLELCPNVEKLNSELQNKIPEFEATYSKMRQLESSNVDLQESNSSLARRVEAAKIKIVELKRALDSTLHRTNELVSSNEALSGELDYHKRELDVALHKIEDTENKLNESLKRENVLSSRERHLVEQISELKGLYYEEKRLKSSFANDASEAKISLDDLRGSYDKVRKLLEEEKATSVRAKSEHLIVANDYEILRGKYGALETEIAAVRERYELQIENLVAQLANSEEKRNSLVSKIDFQEKRYSTLIHKYNSTHTYVSELHRHNKEISAKEVFDIAGESNVEIDFEEDESGSLSFVSRHANATNNIGDLDRGVVRFSAKSADS
jgi:chromosome segregation ATPase